MRTRIGPQYQGDGMANGVAQTSIEKGNDQLGVRDIEVVNSGISAIAAGDLVDVISTTSTNGMLVHVEQHLAAGGTIRNAGGALEGIAIGAVGRIRVEGLQENVNVLTATGTIFALLGGSAATPGRLTTATAPSATVPPPVAIVVVAAAANLASVRWLNPLNL